MDIPDTSDDKDTTIRVSQTLADELYRRKGRSKSYEAYIWELLQRTGTKDTGPTNEEGGEDAVKAELEPKSERHREPVGSPDIEDEVTAVVESIAEGWEDSPERIEQRKKAALAVVEYVRQHSGVSKQEAKEYIFPNHPVEGQNFRTWYRKNIRPVLNEIAAYDQSKRKYTLQEEYQG